MKSFDRFRKDLSEVDRSMSGPGLTGLGLRGLLNVTSKPARTVTSFASSTIDKFKERRKAEREYKDSINKGIQNVRDPEADKVVADASKDADLGKLDRNPPSGETPKDTSPEFQETMRGLGRGKNLSPEEKLKIQRKATGEHKKWEKGAKEKP